MQTKSRRARRMERHHRMHKASPLNLVSLMDIFTILVFFLLVNSSNAPQLPNQKDLKLPESVAQKTPEETLVLIITSDRILLQGREVIDIAALTENDELVIEPLQQALAYQSENRQLSQASDDGADARAITIMGDENISYGLLRRILTTCQEANYTRIAFAAQQKAGPGKSN